MLILNKTNFLYLNKKQELNKHVFDTSRLQEIDYRTIMLEYGMRVYLNKTLKCI